MREALVREALVRVQQPAVDRPAHDERDDSGQEMTSPVAGQDRVVSATGQSKVRNRLRITALAAAIVAAVTIVPTGTAELSITSPAVADFPGITLNGTAQTVNATLDAFSVTDARGTGAGWNVTVQASQFKEWSGTAYPEGGKTLPTGSLMMPAPTVTADGTSSPPPTIQPGAPWAIDVAGAVKIASAAPDTGIGKYDFSSVSLALAIPASAYARTYRTELTVSVASGP